MWMRSVLLINQTYCLNAHVATTYYKSEFFKTAGRFTKIIKKKDVLKYVNIVLLFKVMYFCLFFQNN